MWFHFKFQFKLQFNKVQYTYVYLLTNTVLCKFTSDVHVGDNLTEKEKL